MSDLLVVAGSMVLACWVAAGAWLLASINFNWIAKRRRVLSKVPVPILVAGLFLFAVFVLCAYAGLCGFLPLYLIVTFGSGVSEIGSVIGALLCMYTFGAAPLVVLCLKNPEIRALSSIQRSKLRAPLVIFSSTYLASILLGALGASLLTERALSFAYPKQMSSPVRGNPDALSILPVMALAGIFTWLLGGYFGYRAWKAVASRSLSPEHIRLIAFPRSRSIRKALESAKVGNAAG